MKALRWYGKKDLRYEEIPEPSPGKGEIKVRIHLAGICGSDLKEYASGPLMMPLDKMPLTPGHEFAGRVAELGGDVAGFKIGERITGLGYRFCGKCFYCKKGSYNLCLNSGFTGMNVDGCMAEYLVAPAYSCFRLPDSVSDEYGALVEPLAVSVHAIKQGKVQAGQTVAIVGDGAIGLCTLLAAKAAGAAATYVVSKHRRRGEIASLLGATEVIYLSDGVPVGRVNNLTNGLGADVSFECVGNQDALQLSLNLARRGGTTVLVGVFEMPASLDFTSLMFFEKTITGSAIYTDEARAVIALLADKRIDPGKIISATVPLKDAVKMGFEKLLSNKDDNIKILLKTA